MAKKKEKVEAPKELVKNAAYYEKALANLQKDKDTMQRQYETLLKKGELNRVKYKEAYDQLYAKSLSLHDEKEEWLQEADVAHKDQEALIALIKELVDDTINSLVTVDANTGSISALDAIYHVGMIERVVEAKFNSETEE